MIFYILIKVTINKILNNRRVIVRILFPPLSDWRNHRSLVVEFFAGFRHVLQQLAGSEGHPVGLLEPSHVVDKDLSSHGVDISEGNWNQLRQTIPTFRLPEWSAGEWWEAQTEDGSDVSLHWSGKNPVLVTGDSLVGESEHNNSWILKSLIINN